MHLNKTHAELEELNTRLNEDGFRKTYEKDGNGYHVSFLPRVLGNALIGAGNIVYGKHPSYAKFRAIEVIARVPYHSWTSAVYTLLTLFYMNETRAVELSRTARYAELAQENETMHVVVITKFATEVESSGTIRHTVIPIVFAFFYFWAAYWMYLVNPIWSYELNYLFEDHAYDQYGEFLRMNEAELKQRPAQSAFLLWYGRSAENQYNFFRSIKNDELIHRNMSLDAIRARKKKRAASVS